MTTLQEDEVYDLLILVDSTYSMVNYLEALQSSLPKVIAISNLTNSFARIGLLAYRDYTEASRCKDGMLEWSGWFSNTAEASVDAQVLTSMAANLEPIGGGDYPEATKTALARTYQLMRKDATTIVLLYTDAPPHCWMVADRDLGSNYHAEQNTLQQPPSYDGHGHKFADWVSASRTLHETEKKAHVFCFLDEELGDRALDGGYYTYLSTITRGACFTLTDSAPYSIAQVTVDVLLAWMGAGKAGVENIKMAAKLVRYKSGKNIKNIRDERDELANTYFWASSRKAKGKEVFINPNMFEASQRQEQVMRLEDNLAKVAVTSDVLGKYLPKRRTNIMDFAKRYTADKVYKALVVEQLQTIIETDVTSMSLNPVFGVLWRAVCNDRENPARDKLITAFGLHIDTIKNEDEKKRMRNWLEESYDYASQILDILDGVPEHQRFPCVFIDPTISFAPARAKGDQIDEDEEDQDDQPLSAFRRDELLEIGRSCDERILRRLGKVLTRITYVDSAAELPAHISATSDAEVPKIPTVLASKDYGWQFWKILLHAVLPGTMLAARPAVILAALALKIGLKPLFDAASAAMLFWRERWNNLEIPETWNPSCLELLLDADTESKTQAELLENTLAGEDLLLKKDRELFERLITYHHTGSNFLTTLTAEVSWTPHKTLAPIGPIVICSACKLPRSITIMTERSGGRCGFCVKQSWKSVEHKERARVTNVTSEDDTSTKIAWVECSIQSCRAQYVCYNTADLNVRAKCWYCRNQTSLAPEKRTADPAPTVECTDCLSKIIWPEEWRHLVTTPFQCAACAHGIQTITNVETNAEEICKENGQNWLLQNTDNVLEEPFKRSLFKTITSIGTDSFLENVKVFPDINPAVILTLRGKQIRNNTALITSLQAWAQRQTAERSHCSLCFSTLAKHRLLPACRRHGCHQSVCKDCLDNWYGLNKPGMIINTAALFCPFCRRPPAARTLSAYGKGIHTVGKLKDAYEERGTWIHAWCNECNKAQPLMQRECARGAPEAIQQWQCEDCNYEALMRKQLAEEHLRQALEDIALFDEEERLAAERELRATEAARYDHETPVKECPGCKVPTQKAYGCDHMTCPCGTHWCWTCGEKGASAGDVYDHMDKEHGGFFEEFEED